MLTTNKDFYTHNITLENFNFDEEIFFKKLLFNIQIKENTFFYIVFDEIPSKSKLKKFLECFPKEQIYDFDNFIKTMDRFHDSLKHERNARKMKENEDCFYKSLKIFINDKRFYNTNITIYNYGNSICIRKDYIWYGPTVNGGKTGFSHKIGVNNTSDHKVINFSSIKF